MGLQFARHMLHKGFDVAGYDIDTDAVRRAENDGIRHRGSPAEIGKHAEVVVVMVATDEQVESVVEGSGLIDALAPGSVICIASSVAPETCRRLAALAAAKNIGVLDTPVVLGQEAADNGTCTVYVGGEERWFLRARPVLQTFGRDIMHLGDVGHGQVGKTMNNLLLWVNAVGLMEAGKLAETTGIDLVKLREALMMSSGASDALKEWDMISFTWALKDMQIVADMTDKAGLSLPITGAIKELVKDARRIKASNPPNWTGKGPTKYG